jgi:hypothetical protein
MTDMMYQLKHDGSEEDLKWLREYTGWPIETANHALEQWKTCNPHTAERKTP